MSVGALASDAKLQAADLDELFESVNRSDAPGLVVGVAQHGRTLYRRGFGLASIEHGVANTPRTRMRIGSTSKHFTCLAVLLLAEEGRLDIDATAERYLPELKTLKTQPTLRHLMTHTSGYRCYLDLAFISSGAAIHPKGSALAAQLRQNDVNFAPGENIIYCNGGYHLLGLVIERLSGMSFEDFLKCRILEPLGMKDTEPVPSDFEIHSGLATLYIPQPGGLYRRGIFPSEELRAAGPLISTVDDMLRWLAHLREPKLLGSNETWREMFTVMRLNNGAPTNYALGLMRHDYRGIEVIHHVGRVVGGTCQMLTVPRHALDIIIITNGAPVVPRDLANQIVDILLADEGLGAPPMPASSERFKHLIGTRYYAEKSGFMVGFAEHDAQLRVSVLNGPFMPIFEEGDVLRRGIEDLTMGPLLLQVEQLLRGGTDSAAPPYLQMSELGVTERFDRLDAAEPELLAEASRALVGHYFAPDLDAHAQIAPVGNELELRIFGAFGVSIIYANAISPAVFELKWPEYMPLYGVLSVERTASEVSGFRISTFRTRRLWFKRIANPDSSRHH
jgi:D-aminopeptidase